MACIFCKIINGEIPAQVVYEDDSTMAFLDINPHSFGHTLVMPKKHFVNFEDTPGDVLAATMMTVKKVGRSLKDNLGVSGYNVYENNDPVAGQIIPHLHFHVIPRHENDGLEFWPQLKYGVGEAEAILSKIKIN
ncbi:HIT family protein [Candidatus Falkowbacteria bacterium CG10_big_fil_rev_8_21_14_0_10_39_9]|uniref:HIT family protein n=1 Tax=Candidatus Falkowbacteria bacterium CG10_big_fil_rev_8_21_14_0_10_39_9 TaxID=1974566 RepID=A0A2M6WNG7_9BACT|nr:MAG: HIT family protein [Candidatus Falkowbacteria bacterium CG10_big_fil_rev_8_21_14_0_10_39_9]